jgi:hypothetical protein
MDLRCSPMEFVGEPENHYRSWLLPAEASVAPTALENLHCRVPNPSGLGYPPSKMAGASSAKSRLTNGSLSIANRYSLGVSCNSHAQIDRGQAAAPGLKRQSPSAGGAAERSPARKGWERVR